MNKKKRRHQLRSKRMRRETVALMDANEHLRKALLRAERERSELREANVNLVVERDAADAALDSRMRELAERGDRPKGQP